MKLLCLLPLCLLLIRCSESAKYHPGDSLRITYAITNTLNPGNADTIKTACWKTLEVFSTVHNKKDSRLFVKDEQSRKSLVLIEQSSGGMYMLQDLGPAGPTYNSKFKPTYTGNTKTILGFECREYTITNTGDNDYKNITGWEATALVQRGKSGAAVSEKELKATLELTIEGIKNGKEHTLHITAIGIETPVKDQASYFSMKPPAGYKNLLDPIDPSDQ